MISVMTKKVRKKQDNLDRDSTYTLEEVLPYIIFTQHPTKKIREEQQLYAKLFQSITAEHADMFDVLIVVVTTERLYYRISHVHFDYTGTFEVSNDTKNVTWASSAKNTEWDSEWCEFVFDVYSERSEMFEKRGICKKTPAP